MRIHKTQYSALTDEDMLTLADQQGFNISEIGLELMERLACAIVFSKEEEDAEEDAEETIRELRDEIGRLEDELSSYE